MWAARSQLVGSRACVVVARPLPAAKKVCYERRAQVHRAFLELGYKLICWNKVLRLLRAQHLVPADQCVPQLEESPVDLGPPLVAYLFSGR